MNVDPEYHTKLLELRSMKDFAAICQFMHLFHPAFALEDFETEVMPSADLRYHSLGLFHQSIAPMLFEVYGHGIRSKMTVATIPFFVA